MAKREYKFIYDDSEAFANFKVDTEVFTENHAKATLEFFLWDYDEDSDPITEVLKKYALEVIKEATINNFNTPGVIFLFNNKEGFCKLDGSSGITLTCVKYYEFDEFKLEMIY